MSTGGNYERVSSANGQKDNIDVTFVTGEQETKYTIKRGSTSPAPNPPSKEGYTFAGWVSSEEGGLYHDKNIH